MQSVIYHVYNKIKFFIVHKISFCKIENCNVLTEIADYNILELDYILLAPK